MKINPERIKELCHELLELGITVNQATMESILKMQEEDFQRISEGIDPEAEYDHFLSRISRK